MRARFGLIVERLCVPWGGSLWVSPDGFLREPPELLTPVAGQSTSSPGGLQLVSSAAANGAVVMLREPGLGKSTSLQALVAGLPVWESAQAHENGLAWVDLVDVDATTFHELVTDPLQRLPLAVSNENLNASSAALEQASEPRLTLVLDGVDECPLEPKRLVGRLRRALARRDLGRLRLLVGCRTADYPRVLHELFAALFTKLRVVELTPLTRSNVAALAAARDVDPGAFLDAVTASNVGALAAVPLTLDLLLRLFQRDGQLVDGAAGLFEQGLLVLADEPDEDRRASGRRMGSAHQRVAVAARISATLVLCSKAAVWRGTAADVPETDVPDGAVAGGTEPGPGGPFDVTPDLVAVGLDSALFSSRGAGRRGPAHATFASYLTARHLVEHDLSEQQLRSLLVSVNELGHAGIHPSLRETAAWLVALAPHKTTWLANVVPYDLAVHAVVMESPAVRELLVRRLLDQADTVVLRDRPWARQRWSLSHPKLADQLRPVLKAAVADDQAGRPSRQQLQLAVQLAREAGVATLVDELCDLAGARRWDASLRSWATLAAAELDRNRVAPKLRGLLQELDEAADPEDELRAEVLSACWPEHLSVEELLAALTPPRNPELFGTYRSFRRRLVGRLREEDLPAVLEWARHGMRLHGEEPAMESPQPWADRVGTGERDGQPAEFKDTAVFWPDELPDHEIELLEALVDRALMGPGAPERIQLVATLLGPRLAAHDAGVPTPVDLVDAAGQEPPDVRGLRRDLVVALLGLIENQEQTYLLVYGWRQRRQLWLRSQDLAGDGDLVPANSTGLLRQDDLDWLLELEAVADDTTAARLHVLIAAVFAPLDNDAQEMAWQHKGTRVWERVFARYFEAVNLRSEAARRAREQQRLLAPTTDATGWSGRDDFVRFLGERLTAAASGDAASFWQLCHFLQADPGTGKGFQRHDDDVTTWPGVAVLGDGWRDVLLTAAKQYLVTEAPHAEEWLGTRQWDRRAWAGYLALALLARHGLHDTVAEDTWVTWAPAILWFGTIPWRTGDQALKRQFLSHISAIAPDVLVEPATRILHGALEVGTRPSELELLQSGWTGPLADAFARELDELVDDLVLGRARSSAITEALTQAREGLLARGASEQPTATDTPEQQAARRELQQAQGRAQALVDTVELLARLLVNNGERRGVEACRRLLEAIPTSQGSVVRSAAIQAAEVLLEANAQAHWPSVLATARANAAWGNQLMAHMARDWADPGLPDQLNEAGLAELYTWMAEPYPPETDVVITVAHAVSPEEQIRHWRDVVLGVLAERGSAQAVRELAGLVGRWPDRASLRSHLLQAEERQQEAGWKPPAPAELQALLADRRRRLVRSAAELTDVVVDALSDIAQALPEHGQLLWDMRRIPSQQDRSSHQGGQVRGSTPTRRARQQELWRPKNEHALSAYLKDQLQHRLAGRTVIVNREVLVRQTSPSGAGDRVGLLVEATALPGAPTGISAAEDPGLYAVRVVIEVKGCWHDQLMSAMRTQLADDYLDEASTKHGVYVVGWFPIEQWNDTDDWRWAVAAQRDRHQTVRELDRQAAELSQAHGLDLRAVMLDVPRPSPSRRNIDPRE